MNIPTELWINVISQYLTYKEIILLYNSLYISKVILNKIFINRILSKLKSIFSKYYNILIDLIKNNELCITGSFILQVILDTYYNASDIDFCCDKRYKGKCELFLNELDINNQKYIKDYPGLSINAQNLTESLINEVLTFHYLMKTNPLKHTQKIQFIFLESETDINMKYINTFDINVVKNLLYYKDGEFNLYINNLNDILYNYMTVNLYHTSYDRIKKYMERNFTIIGDNKSEILQYLLKINTSSRVFKYIPDINDKNIDILSLSKIKKYTNNFIYDIENKTLLDANLFKNCECFEYCYIKKFFGNIKHEHIILKTLYKKDIEYVCKDDCMDVIYNIDCLNIQSDIIIY